MRKTKHGHRRLGCHAGRAGLYEPDRRLLPEDNLAELNWPEGESKPQWPRPEYKRAVALVDGNRARLQLMGLWRKSMAPLTVIN